MAQPQPQPICGSTDTADGEPCQHPAGWGLDRNDVGYCAEHAPSEGSAAAAAASSNFESTAVSADTGGGGPLAAWRDYLPTETEQGSWQGAFSTRGEVHAAGIGFGVGAAAAAAARPELMVSIALIAIGEAQAQGEQLRDVAAEPAYALAALVVGYLAVGFGVNPVAIERLVELLNAGGIEHLLG